MTKSQPGTASAMRHDEGPTVVVVDESADGAVKFYEIRDDRRPASRYDDPAGGPVREQRSGRPDLSLLPAQVTRASRPAVSQARLEEEMSRELHRAQLASRPGVLAAISVAELDRLRAHFGSGADHALSAAIDELLATDAPTLEQHSVRAEGGFYVLMPETGLTAALVRMQELSRRTARAAIDVDGEEVRVTPVIGYSTFAGTETAEELREHAAIALENAASHLDLVPVGFSPELPVAPSPSPVDGPRSALQARVQSVLTESVRVGLQIGFTLALLVLAPFVLYIAFWYAGFDITTITYPLMAIGLAGTAAGLWIESFKAVGSVDVPDAAAPPPPASAIIAAYLPNEAATILATVTNMLDEDYPGGLQVILAYNTPKHLPIEDVLAELSASNPRLLLLRVQGSTSKAQNVNAALGYVRGQFVGVFDADHHPEQGSFSRAWQWLSNGHDIVQGHCVVRNGDASPIARLVAVEFETIYAVSHPGRARLHGFGIFGGSNGYWRTESLRQIRMQGSMLTEDIDSSMRSLLDGFSIVSDPGLISTELAPITLKALWNQRVRWAQGWTQTARRHIRPAMRSNQLSGRQKAGAAFLLGWTQIVPWVTIQVVPILAFTAWRDGGVGRIDLLVPLFVLLTLFTFSVGPAQAVFAYVLGDERVRRHRGWFWLYGLHSVLWFGEFKNLISRVAQLKELIGERQWRVTPRAVEIPDVVDVRTADERSG